MPGCVVLRHALLDDALPHLIVGQLFLCPGGERQGEGGDGDQTDAAHRECVFGGLPRLGFR